MTWHAIRLELARTPTFVDGSNVRGYELRAPLTADGHLDEDAWRADRKAAVVRRFWAGEPDAEGRLIHTRHRTWAFSYAPGEDDDTPFYHLETHRFVPGEYVSITEQDGETLPFRVTSVRPTA